MKSSNISSACNTYAVQQNAVIYHVISLSFDAFFLGRNQLVSLKFACNASIIVNTAHNYVR